MKPKPTKEVAEQDTFAKVFMIYKRKCDMAGSLINLTIKDMLEKAGQKNKLENIKFNQNIGPLHMRALFEAFIELKFAKIKSISTWKSEIGDEGIRNICRYVQNNENNILEVLDVLENKVSSLGCEFLSKILIMPTSQIKHLKLDNNLIGNKGIQNLSLGLRANEVLTKLSLKYCGINAEGVKYVQVILANISSKIRSIKLQGNHIGNQGIYQFFRAVELNEMLEKINLADTGLNLLDFKSKVLHIEDQSQTNEKDKQDEELNPQRASKKVEDQIGLENVKQIVLPEPKLQTPKRKVVFDTQKSEEKKRYKDYNVINETDNSLSANIMRIMTYIMKQNILIRKYDLRFNPISNDAAFILFEIIEQNSQIKDVEINNNVDNSLRENLDTLMRKRTGRLQKGKTGRSKNKSKSKLKSKKKK